MSIIIIMSGNAKAYKRTWTMNFKIQLILKRNRLLKFALRSVNVVELFLVFDIFISSFNVDSAS